MYGEMENSVVMVTGDLNVRMRVCARMSVDHAGVDDQSVTLQIQSDRSDKESEVSKCVLIKPLLFRLCALSLYPEFMETLNSTIAQSCT